MIESDNYRDDQLYEYLKTLEYEEQEEELEKVVLADDGEIAEPYHCLGCGERLETNVIYGYCKYCQK